MQTHPHSIAAFFGMAGVAKWCADEPNAGVGIWESGLDAQFADGAGGVDLPLFLLVASILRPSVFSRSEATRILEKRVKDPRVKNWPGALAQFVLNLIDERALEERSIHGRDRKAPPSVKWRIAFYKPVLELDRADLRLTNSRT
jgi:hypothetical protein